MPIEPPPASPPIIHTRLDGTEERVEALHFLSMMAVVEFFSHGALNMVLPYVIALALPLSGELQFEFGIQLTAALVALGVLWTLYQVDIRLILPGIIVFTIGFSAFAVRTVLFGNLAIFQYSFENTIASWSAVGCFLLLLAYVDYQFIRAAWNMSKASKAERLLMRGETRTEGFLLRVLGIPAICQWLSRGWQRRTAVALFVLSMAAFSFFVTRTWNSLFLLGPVLEYTYRTEVRECLAGPEPCFEAVFVWLTGPLGFLGLFGITLGVVVGLRFAARRFTRLSLERLISTDGRPLILFLRSFRDDQVKLDKPRRNILRTMVAAGEPRPTLDHVLPGGRHTLRSCRGDRGAWTDAAVRRRAQIRDQ
jgi:hypothetical protein